MSDTLERLRHQVEHRSGMTEQVAISYADLSALLDIAEAAQDLLFDLATELSGQSSEKRLREALAALDSTDGAER